MARELIEKRVDGNVYSFQQFNTTKSLKIMSRLSKILLEPITLFFASAGGKASSGNLLDRQLDKDMLGKAVRSLTDRMDEDEVINLIKELTANDNLLVDGKKVDFDTHYEGRLDHLFKVLYAALEVQYGNFLGALIARIGSASANTTPAPQA